MEDENKENKFQERVNYYKLRLKDYLKPFTLDFLKFVADPEAIKLGDYLLSRNLSSGYNFAPNGEFPIDNSESVIVYSMYA